MKLKAFQKKYLKSIAHDMNVLVHIGKNGLSEESIKKINADLDAHELIKIKVHDPDVVEIKEVATTLREKLGCHVIRVIGKTAILFRENPDNEDNEFILACGKKASRKKLKKSGSSQE